MKSSDKSKFSNALGSRCIRNFTGYIMASITVMFVFAGMTAFGSDSEWIGYSKGDPYWDSVRVWKNFVPAGGGIDDIAYLRSQYKGTGNGPSLNLRSNVVLHGIEVTGNDYANAVFNRSIVDGGSSFLMKKNSAGENPYVRSEPSWRDNNRGGLEFNNENFFAGDADTTLEMSGGLLCMGGGSVSNYLANGFALVDLSDYWRIAVDQNTGRGLSDGDIRISRVKFNCDNGSRACSLAAGKMTIGGGLSFCRMGKNTKMLFPHLIDREPMGYLALEFYNNEALGYELPKPAQYMNADGRFFSWWLNVNYEFVTWDDEKGIVSFNNYQTDPAVSTSTTSLKFSGVTTLPCNTEAAVVLMTGGDLRIDEGTKLTLGNESEPGVIKFSNSLRGEGEIEFKGPEGALILQNASQHIEPRLVGTNSVTLIAAQETADIYPRNKNNSFSGGFNVLRGNLYVLKGFEGVLGTGRVNVDGFPGSYEWGKGQVYGRGGSLTVENTTVTNELWLAGTGANNSGAQSALHLKSGARVTGPIKLKNGAAIRSDTSNVNVDGDISGDKRLCLWPEAPGEMKLSGAIANAAEIAITAPTNALSRPIQMGTVSIADVDNFNVAKIRNDAMLVLSKGKVFDSEISGVGSIAITGNDTATTFRKEINQGGFFAEGNQTVRLESATNKIGTIVGESVIEITSQDSQLTIGSGEVGYDGYFRGAIQTPAGGKLKLVKTGSNMQVLGSQLSFDGEVVIEGGILKLGGFADKLPKTSYAPEVHSDASRPETITLDGDGRVSRWAAIDGARKDLVQNDESMMPGYDPNAMGGRGGIVFNNSDWCAKDDPARVLNRLHTDEAIKIKKVYMAYSINRQTCYGTLFGGLDLDSTGVRMGWTTSGAQPGATYGLEGSYAASRGIDAQNIVINGVTGAMSGATGTVQLAEFRTTQSPFNYRLGIGQCFQDDLKTRGINGAIGEVVIYPSLNVPEDYMVTKYMRTKWGFANADEDATENVLPRNAKVTIKEGAVLDLAGVDQEFARLDNYGTIVNSSSRPVVVTVTEGGSVGTIKGAVKFVKKGDGDLWLDRFADLTEQDGSVAAESGAMKLRTWHNVWRLPIENGIAFHLDAADTDSMTTNELGRVMRWADKSGNGNDFVADDPPFSAAYPVPPPKYVATLNGGRGGLLFEGNASAKLANRLSSENSVEIRTIVFYLMTDTADGQNNQTYKEKYQTMGLFGIRNVDDGIRMTTYNAYATYYSFNYIDLYRINGAPGTAFVPGDNYVLEMSLNEANAKGYNHRWSLGQYMGAWNASEGPNNYSGGLRGYNGMIAEVIAFNRELTADERASVVAYLKEKWENSDSTATVSFEDQNLKLELGDATLDLAGTSQRLDGIAGAGGSICNGSMVISGEIEFDVSATNPTFDFGGAAIEDGLKVTFASTPDRVRYVIARNVGSGNVATFIPPAPGWYLSLSNGELVASRGGMVIIIK